jgi:hypothetical protein
LGSWRSALTGDRVPGSALGNIEWVRRALLAWDAATTYWNNWVIGYGPELQRALLDAFGLESSRRSDRWTRLLLMSVGVTLVASFALSIFLTIRQRRRTPVDSAARAFAVFSRKLGRLRIAPLAAGEGPVSYGDRAQRTLPHAGADIAAIVAAYLRARYEPDADRAALAELRARVAGFRPARVGA